MLPSHWLYLSSIILQERNIIGHGYADGLAIDEKTSYLFAQAEVLTNHVGHVESMLV